MKTLEKIPDKDGENLIGKVFYHAEVLGGRRERQ
jgi:hypothetical protein